MLIYLLTIIEMCHCGCGNALKPKALHVFESRRKSPLWTYGADSRPSEWIHVRQCYSSDGGNIVFHKGEKRFLEINDTLLIIEEACLSLTFFFFCCKMWTSTDVHYMYFPLFVCFNWLSSVFWPKHECCCIFKFSVTPSSDAIEPQLIFPCSIDYIYIHYVYLYMYEYKYIYIVDIWISIRMCTVWGGLLCIYCYVRIAAKAKLWFNLGPHICFKWVDTTRFYVSTFFSFHNQFALNFQGVLK